MTDRRAFLQLLAGAGPASLVAACGWDGGNAVRPWLLEVSRLNDWVGEKRGVAAAEPEAVAAV